MRQTIRPDRDDVFGKLRYRPNEKGQQPFHDATEDEVLLAGRRGGGKTRALVMEGVRLCAHYPGIRVLVIRRSYPQLRATVVAELAKVGFCKRLGAQWNSTEMELRFPNGSLLKCGYIDALVDTAQYQGQEFQCLMIDELGLMIPEALPILRESLRSSNPAIPIRWLRCTANPGGPSHSFVRAHFINATDDGRKVITDEQDRTTRFIRSSVFDNEKHVGRKYIAILEGIEDPARRKSMLAGDFNSFFGQVFQEWDPTRHIVGPRKDVHVPAEWRRFAGIDYRFAAAWAVIWFAIDGDGRAWATREMYERGLSPAEQARRIIDAERKAGEVNVVHWIDPSTAAAVHAGAPSIQQMYAAEGLGTALADNSRVPGWQAVHSYLAEGPICPWHAALRDRDAWRGDTCPKLHVVEGTCPNFVRTLPALPYDPVRVEDVDTKADDHVADAARYCLHSLSAGGGGGPVLYPEFAGSEYLRPLTIEEMGGPAPQPMILGSPYAGDLSQGLREAGVSFERAPGAERPGETKRSPFV
jgi:hypothetical protein